jgi:hypothetical protein
LRRNGREGGESLRTEEKIKPCQILSLRECKRVVSDSYPIKRNISSLHLGVVNVRNETGARPDMPIN